MIDYEKFKNMTPEECDMELRRLIAEAGRVDRELNINMVLTLILAACILIGVPLVFLFAGMK